MIAIAQRSGPVQRCCLGRSLGSNWKAIRKRLIALVSPHVGSPRNNIFKRFMYATPHPVMLFMTSAKIDCPVKPEHCHFILEQAQNRSEERRVGKECRSRW